MNEGKTIQELLDAADRALAAGTLPPNEHRFAHDLAKEIERQKIQRNNEQAMKGLDQHFEYRGGCFDERDRYDS